mgnify:CR=1 FL=1
MAGTKTETIINGLKTEIVRVVTEKLSVKSKEAHHLATAWRQMEEDAVDEIISLLKKHLSTSVITKAKSKSVYPDIKITNTEGVFAIDIKVSVDSQDPWYDMARLDTVLEARIHKYVEEWELVIKYRGTDGEGQHARRECAPWGGAGGRRWRARSNREDRGFPESQRSQVGARYPDQDPGRASPRSLAYRPLEKGQTREEQNPPPQ